MKVYFLVSFLLYSSCSPWLDSYTPITSTLLTLLTIRKTTQPTLMWSVNLRAKHFYTGVVEEALVVSACCWSGFCCTGHVCRTRFMWCVLWPLPNRFSSTRTVCSNHFWRIMFSPCSSFLFCDFIPVPLEQRYWFVVVLQPNAPEPLRQKNSGGKEIEGGGNVINCYFFLLLFLVCLVSLRANYFNV